MRIARWHHSPNAAGTIIGFLDIELPSGLVIHGCKLLRGVKGGVWLKLTDAKRRDRDEG